MTLGLESRDQDSPNEIFGVEKYLYIGRGKIKVR